MLFVLKNPEHKQKVLDYIGRLPDRPLGYKLSIEFIRNSRSCNQRKYMWFTFAFIGTELDERKEDVYWYYVNKFLLEEVEIMGKKIMRPRETKTLNTMEQEIFMRQVREDVFNNFNIFCLLPNEVVEG